MATSLIGDGQDSAVLDAILAVALAVVVVLALLLWNLAEAECRNERSR